MTRPLPAAFDLTGERLYPFWCVQIDFTTPLRLCSRWEMTIGSDTFSHAGLDEFELARLEQIILVNENRQYTSTFWDQPTAGVGLKVWQGYGQGLTWQYADLLLMFDGQIGSVGIGRDIAINLNHEKRRQTPGLVIGDVIEAGFLIPDGAKAITPDGIITLTTV